MANKATLESLKSIHDMQKDGVILEFLRNIRGLKSELDDFSKRAILAKKQKTEEESKKSQEALRKEVKPETEKKVIEKEEEKQAPQVFVAENKNPENKTNFRKFDQNSSFNQNSKDQQKNRWSFFFFK